MIVGGINYLRREEINYRMADSCKYCKFRYLEKIEGKEKYFCRNLPGEPSYDDCICDLYEERK